MPPYIVPEIPKGTRDFSPGEMARRNYVLEKMKSVFVTFGYDPIETPAFEYAKTIHGKYGDEAAKLTYTFLDHGGRKLALRYDQTVPFARFVAANHRKLSLPFKRYQISPVWRADKPAKGRYREFYQCDIDIVGTGSLLAEAEIAQVIAAVCESLGFESFVIKFNSRRLVNSLLSRAGIAKDKQVPVIRVLDKLDKTARGRVLESLCAVLPEKKAGELLCAVSAEGSNPEKLARLQERPGGIDETAAAEIQNFLSLCQTAGVPEKILRFEPGLARGLDYYTGLVFEVVLPGVNLGPVCAGGRYDNLCSAFCDEKFSGAGAAFGLDRLLLALDELKMLDDLSLHAQVLVTYFDEPSLPASLKIAGELREAGVKTELYFQPDRLSKQMRFADKKNIPFVVICGPEEIQKGEAQVKIMKTGKQKQIPQTQLALYLKGYRP